MRKFILDTGLMQIWSAKAISTTPNFVPLTGPINTTMIRNVRAAWELVGVTGALTVKPAYRMSADGITWSSTITGLLAAYSATTGWSYDTAASADEISTDLMLFVQFGFLVANASATGQVEMGQARLRLEIAPTNGQTFVAGPIKVWSDGTDTNQIFHPMTGPIVAEQISSYRGSLQMQGDSGACALQMADQVSDDGITWYDNAASPTAGGATTFGTEMTTASIDEGTTFTAFAFATGKGRQLVRFGVAVQNDTDTGKSECSAASLRIDIRGS